MTTASTIQAKLTREENDSMATGQTQYLSTAEAYDLWSEVYDTDGNFLQALDSIEVALLLPAAINGLLHSRESSNLKAVDLGCGTGRNTLHLLDFDVVSDVIGLELSPKMMSIAKSACEVKLTSLPNSESKSLAFATYDMISEPDPPTASQFADIVISTLVLEHIPLASFFHVVSRMLRPGGVLLLTNMHARMGDISQAGFVDPRTGNKIRPTSYAHEVSDVVKVASEHGLELEGLMKEVSVDAELAARLGQRGKKWIGVTVWFGGIWKMTKER